MIMRNNLIKNTGLYANKYYNYLPTASLKHQYIRLKLHSFFELITRNTKLHIHTHIYIFIYLHVSVHMIVKIIYNLV